MAFFIIIFSDSMLMRRVKLCLVTIFLFTFYWCFFFYWGDIFASFNKFPNVASLYLSSGTIYISLTLIAFFQEG